MKTIQLPTQEYLLDCFENIGPHLIWLERPVEHFDTYGAFETWNRRFAGTIAGSTSNSAGYVHIQIKTIMYKAHRIVYKIHTGCEPDIIDHINRIRTDNRFENLRSGTFSDNLNNKSMYKNNTSGHKGIHETRTGWVVLGSVNGKRFHVGVYPTLEEAIQAKKEWDEA